MVTREMTPKEERIEREATAYAKKNRARIVKELTNPEIYLPEENPVSVFMAGSPGAGKTEASIELIEIESGDEAKVIRIDPDELRELLPGYTGTNAWLYQRAVIPIVERMIDSVLKKSQSFVLDGTLCSYSVAEKNIERSLKRGRTIQILYVYQEPEQAWAFVQAREVAEKRRIEPEDFVDKYFAARDVVNQIKSHFGKDVHVDLLMKNNDGSNRFYRAGVDQIDHHISEKYSREDLYRMLGI